MTDRDLTPLICDAVRYIAKSDAVTCDEVAQEWPGIWSAVSLAMRTAYWSGVLDGSEETHRASVQEIQAAIEAGVLERE